jgi:nucleotide-binding universal stress UspA family protein
MRLQHIIAATDFSQRASRAVSRAGMLASEYHATLDLVHVTTALPSGELEQICGKTPEELQQEDRADIHRTMAQQLQTLRERFRVDAEPRLLTGKPYAEIPRLAAERNADLIVIGAHGEHLFYDLFIGATAEKMVQRMTQPLLIVKQTPKSPYRNLLIPIDFSASSALALSVATAYFPEAVVAVLHAYEVLFERTLIGAGVPDAELSQQRQKVRTEALHRMATLVHTGRYKPARVALHAQHGRPDTVIRAMTEQLEPDLIVMGKSEQSVLEKLLIGSTTMHVLRELLCDVLIVMPE